MKTLTEEMPSRPSEVAVVFPTTAPRAGDPAVTVVPVPIPTTATPAPTTGTPTSGAPTTSQPPTTTAPAPTATTPPTSNPTTTTGAPCIHGNTNPVARISAGVSFIECDGNVIPNSGGTTQIKVGCRVHLDSTPKDASGRPTCSNNVPHWSYSNGSIVGGHDPDDFTPAFVIKGVGTTTASCRADGVNSNEFTLTGVP